MSSEGNGKMENVNKSNRLKTKKTGLNMYTIFCMFIFYVNTNNLFLFGMDSKGERRSSFVYSLFSFPFWKY